MHAAKILILSYKISFFAFTDIVLERRYLEILIAPLVKKYFSIRNVFYEQVFKYWEEKGYIKVSALSRHLQIM